MLSAGVWRTIRKSAEGHQDPWHCFRKQKAKPLQKCHHINTAPMNLTTLTSVHYIRSAFFHAYAWLVATARPQLKMTTTTKTQCWKGTILFRKFPHLILLQNKCLWIVITSKRTTATFTFHQFQASESLGM